MLNGQLQYRSQRFVVERVTYRDSQGHEFMRDVIRHPGSVVIVPLVTADQVCLIRNYRASVDEHLIELPAGTLESGEPAEQCAARELTEETGFRARTWKQLTSFYAAPGILDEHMRLFLASDLDQGSPAREPGEQIQNLVVSLDEALRMVHDGTIKDAKTIIGLMLYSHQMGPTG